MMKHKIISHLESVCFTSRVDSGFADDTILMEI